MLAQFNKISIGDKLNGFKYLRKFSVPEFKLHVHELEHQNASTKYYHFERDDNNKTFNVLFNTTPFNNSGLSHILEHTVLCGSKKFPIRDPFFNMLRRSQSNFMNALTGYDYTCYPFSTYNEIDFFNLLSVYLDAVFNPILRETDFMQEGWRLEPKNFPHDPKSSTEIKGIVYNEMKGVFSNSSNTFMYRVLNELLPETYGFISGGDPKDITNLTWNDLKSYHKKYYSPMNATLLTYGNLNVNKFTDILDKEYLSKQIDNFKYKPTPVESHWVKPKEITIACPPDTNSPFKDRDSTISISYKIANVEDVYLSLKMNLLSSLLTDGENAPLYRELISDGQLGLNWSMKGFDNSSKTTSFHIGIEGVRQTDLTRVQEKINQVLKQCSETPFPKERVEALLHAYELAIKTDSVKFGLKTILNCASPIVHKQNLEQFISIQRYLDRLHHDYKTKPSLFSDLIKEFLLDNTHKLVSIMRPDEAFLSRQIESEKHQLEKLEKSHNPESFQENLEKCHLLYENQNRKENVSILPCLKISDIPEETSKEPFEIVKCDKIEFQLNEQDTNGIIYTKLLFDLNHLPQELISYLPLYSEILTRIGTSSMSHLEFSLKEELFTAGIKNNSGVRAKIDSHGIDDLEATNIYFYISSAFLERNLLNYINLLEVILNHQPKWSETSRILQLIEMYTQSSWSSNSLAHSGHSVAMSKAYSGMNKTASISEAISGLNHGEMVISLIKQGSSSIPTTIEKLKAIHEHVFNKDNVRISLTGPKDLMVKTLELLSKSINDLKKPNPSNLPTDTDIPSIQNENFYYAMPYQVHYVAKAIKTVCQFDKNFPSISVLAKLISSKYLHSEIREKGGAYGGGCVLKPGSLTFYSYRDPNFLQTLETFEKSLDWAKQQSFSEQDLLEAKLSIFSGYDSPVNKRSMGDRYFFSRITDDLLNQRRQRLFGVSIDDIKIAAEKLSQTKDISSICTLGPKESFIESHVKNDDSWTMKEQFNIELGWAIKAYEHAEVHMNLLKAIPDSSKLKLTPIDDQIYEDFMKNFSHLKIDFLAEDDLKSKDQKEKWRDFCNSFEGQVADFNMATLLRLDTKKAYDQENTCIVPRIQFLAIEIARNRLNLNDKKNFI